MTTLGGHDSEATKTTTPTTMMKATAPVANNRTDITTSEPQQQFKKSTRTLDEMADFERISSSSGREISGLVVGVSDAAGKLSLRQRQDKTTASDTTLIVARSHRRHNHSQRRKKRDDFPAQTIALPQTIVMLLFAVGAFALPAEGVSAYHRTPNQQQQQLNFPVEQRGANGSWPTISWQQQQPHHNQSRDQLQFEPEMTSQTESRSSGKAATTTGTEQQTEEGRAAHWSLPNRPSLFSIIRFPNEECFDSSNQSGTCYTAFECKLLGGQPSSPCAAGFGSCCIVSRTCHVTTREKVVYFKNPSYPSADSDEKFCDLTVEMSDINVCQIRLDFLDFQLDPPTNGACQQDYMEISASGMPPQTVPRLCGLNRNQHLYITVPQDFSERSASIVFYTDPVGDHRWQLKVTQIDCNHYKPIDWKRSYGKFATSPLWNPHPNALKLPGNLMGKYSTTFASGFQTMSQTASALAYEFLKPQFTPRAPMGCLQYFTQSSGIIESFNFGQYLNNMDYSICVQRQPDTCRVVFTSSDYDWSINGVGVSGSSSGVGDQDCARDYLLIPGASRTGDGFTYDRYCGGRLNYYRGQALSAPVVIKTAGPIVLRFHSDGQFESLNNGGFRLQYDQSAQDCIYHTAEESGSLASQQILASTLSDSRPLNQHLGNLVNEPPVLYASQHLSLAPLHQLTSSTSELLDSQQQVVDSSSSDVAKKQPLSLYSMGGSLAQSVANHKPATDPSDHLANAISKQVFRQHHNQQVDNNGQQQQLEPNDTTLQAGNAIYHQQQATLSDRNNIKRSDFVAQSDPSLSSVSPSPSSSADLHQSKQHNRNTNLLADLNRAFQLITARSASSGNH